jgi:hypothetical protein
VSNHPRLTSTLLDVRFRARALGDVAQVVHYTDSSFHLKRLEAEMEALDRSLAGLRMTLQAIRSRGEEPVS